MKADKTKQIVVRIAPSPTGNLHIGTARTALYNFLFARNRKGKFIVRVEDTDKERSKKEYEENIINGFKWLGFSYDEFYRQSEREDIYKSYLKKMIDGGFAYLSKEEITEEGQRGEVIRFKNPKKLVTFDDLVRGAVTFDTTELGDFVIARSMEEPLYHLAVVIDDFEMGVTHVIRGEDHISNTPRQILIAEAIGAERPLYAHIPLILAPDRSKLSKRHGAVSLHEYGEKGYLPEALVNYLALLGWNPGTDQEIFTLDELIAVFDISKIQKGGAIFDEEKLKWINSEHKKRLEKENPQKFIETFKIPAELFPIEVRSNIISTLQVSGAQYSTTSEQISMINEAKKLEPFGKDLLLWKDEKDFDTTLRHIKWVGKAVSEIEESLWNANNIKAKIWDYASREGRGNVLWPMRVALSGKEKSPDPFVLAGILGKDETMKRLLEAENKFK